MSEERRGGRVIEEILLTEREDRKSKRDEEDSRRKSFARRSDQRSSGNRKMSDAWRGNIKDSDKKNSSSLNRRNCSRNGRVKIGEAIIPGAAGRGESEVVQTAGQYLGSDARK